MTKGYKAICFLSQAQSYMFNMCFNHQPLSETVKHNFHTPVFFFNNISLGICHQVDNIECIQGVPSIIKQHINDITQSLTVDPLNHRPPKNGTLW